METSGIMNEQALGEQIQHMKRILTINEQRVAQFVKIDKKIRRRVVKKPVCLEQRWQDQRVQNSAQQ